MRRVDYVQRQHLGEHKPGIDVPPTEIPPGSYEDLVNLRVQGPERQFLESVDGHTKYLSIAVPGGQPGRAVALVPDPSGGGGFPVYIEGPRIHVLVTTPGGTAPAPTAPDLPGNLFHTPTPSATPPVGSPPNHGDPLPVVRDGGGGGTRHAFGNGPCTDPEYWSVGGIGGLPSVHYNGSTQYLSYGYLDVSSFETANPWTAVFVIQPDAAYAADGWLLGNQRATGNEEGWGVFLGSDLKMNVRLQSDGTHQLWVKTTNALVAGTSYIVVATYDGSGTAGAFAVYVSSTAGVALTTVAATLAAGIIHSGGDLTTGARQGTDYWYHGLISELSLFRLVLLDADRAALVTGLALKYGITLT